MQSRYIADTFKTNNHEMSLTTHHMPKEKLL